jgi:asparagine synthase (glutamine-hydrolysing)
MSVIFGIHKLRGDSVTRRELFRFSAATERYAPDGTKVTVSGRTGMGIQYYRTHERSNLETGPAMDELGNMITLDGRIDNHADIAYTLDLTDKTIADSLIVLAAFRRWGEDCFSRLVGDWALALWSAKDQTLYLARDHAGARTLYFKSESAALEWATYLEPLVLGNPALSIDEQYVARYLTMQPIRDLTPYKGVRSVPPAHYLVFRDGRVTTNPHWDWMAARATRFRSDTEYDEQFLFLFKQSVARRTGPGAPVLAQLSGGMDSTSVVCLSDHIRRAQGLNSDDFLDTISLYDDTEPNWDERPYFSIVESLRGKTGIHVQISSHDRSFVAENLSDQVVHLPGRDSASLGQERVLQESYSRGGYRAILSGIGGDEVLGGVPTPDPEMAVHLMSGKLATLISRSIAWCVPGRTPLLHMLGNTLKFTIELYRPKTNLIHVGPWIAPHLTPLCAAPTRDFTSRQLNSLRTPLAICNGTTWWAIMETLPHLQPKTLVRSEYRYPFLDRDLIEFLFSVPREQLVQPGRRRSMMRRALHDIVPTEILERRRKAFMIRSPLLAIKSSAHRIQELFSQSIAVEMGWIEGTAFRGVLDTALAKNDPKWLAGLTRAVSLELWLQSNRRLLQFPGHAHQSSLGSLRAAKIHTA